VTDVKPAADDPSATTGGASAGPSTDSGASTDAGTGSGANGTQVAQAEKRDAAPEVKPKKDRQVGRKLVAGFNALRSRIATVVWLIAVVCALFLAVGALMVALKMNGSNAIVAFIKDGARFLDLGKFKTFDGKNALVKDRLTNWGIAAVIYLLVGKLLDRIIRP
jgi:hypothetical protein